VALRFRDASDFKTSGTTSDGCGNLPFADVGVAILKEPVTDLPLMRLPPMGFLNTLEASGELRAGSDRAKFTVVGYGTVLGGQPVDYSLANRWPAADGCLRIPQSA